MSIKLKLNRINLSLSVLGTTIAHVVPPYVEPGRLEARVSEYYKKLEIALGITPQAAPGKILLYLFFYLFAFFVCLFCTIHFISSNLLLFIIYYYHDLIYFFSSIYCLLIIYCLFIVYLLFI